MRRLLLIASEFPPGPGGIGTQAVELASGLQRHGWDVRVAATQDHRSPDEIRRFNAELPFRITGLRRGASRAASAIIRAAQVSRICRAWRPDVGLATGDPSVYLMAMAGGVFGFPWVAVEHGRRPTSHLEALIKRHSFQRATRAVSVSRFTHQYLQELVDDASKSVTIHNGGAEDRFKLLPRQDVEGYRRAMGLDGARVILTVGSVTSRKGQDLVIRALPKILESAPDARYLMAGHAPRQAELIRLAERLGVAERLRFLGNVPPREVVLLMNCADVFVLNSRRTDDEFEGFGIAVVEAAMCGTPAVVSAGTGLMEAILDGETGLSVPQDDPSATAEAVVRLLRDDHLRRGMAERARARALSDQTWGRRVAEYHELLRGLLASRAGSRDVG